MPEQISSLRFPSELQVRIGVFGGAFVWDQHAEQCARELGEEIAQQGCILVTGATTGLPHRAGSAALAHGGFVLGISPAGDLREHVEKFRKPLGGSSVIVWTGLGYTGRDFINIRNCDGAIFVGGETGTLQEFCIANYEGKVIGVMEGSGGIADKIRDIMKASPTDHGAVIEYDKEPRTLVRKVIDRLRERGASENVDQK